MWNINTYEIENLILILFLIKLYKVFAMFSKFLYSYENYKIPEKFKQPSRRILHKYICIRIVYKIERI